MDDILHKIGLTQNESVVYLAYLKHKENTAAEIARIIRMDKSSCYRAVDELVTKGLLLTVPRKRGTTHTAASPEILKELLHAKKHELHTQEQQLNDLVNKLIKEANDKRSTFIKVEKGIQAVRDSMDRNLSDAICSDKMIKEKYRLDYPYFKDKEHIKWVNDFVKRRVKAGVSTKVIVDFMGETVFAPVMRTDKKILKEIRLMPKEIKDMNSMRLAGDTTVITSFDENKDYVVITIKDRFVTELMNSFFDFIWERSEKYI